MNALGRFIYQLATHLFEGFVLKTVWAWFIVPLGVIALPYWTAVVIVLLVGWLVMQLPFTGWDTFSKELTGEKGHEASMMRTTMFLYMAGEMLLFAWVVHLITR